MTKKRQILCNYCGDHTDYVDSSEVYSRSYGMIYLCKPCNAWVGVHKNTDKPLGRLANSALRDWKKKAHAAFDPLWKRKLEIRQKERGSDYKKAYARGSGYKWLGKQMGIDSKDCHIGMFDIEQCKRVVEICSPYNKK